MGHIREIAKIRGRAQSNIMVWVPCRGGPVFGKGTSDPYCKVRLVRTVVDEGDDGGPKEEEDGGGRRVAMAVVLLSCCGRA